MVVPSLLGCTALWSLREPAPLGLIGLVSVLDQVR